MKNRSLFFALFLLIALIGISVWSVYLVRPPQPLPADAPPDAFSAGRAMQHVRAVAQEPHAMGTAAHAQVRSYLLNELHRLGLQTEVQETTIRNPMGEVPFVGHVYNVIGRLKGRTNGKAVLLMAHYDSQPNTRGAGDDGAGVAALLETARVLQAGTPLQNDVLFLFTDGEEYGLYGASAFLHHPWAQEVGLVINLEGRGNSGPSMTFEISPENGWVIEEFAKAAPYPFASSLMYEVYRHLPNYTDFTIFRDAGFAGVNSAFIDGFVHYHKMTDSPENLDPASLQHHGSNLLAMARHFGNLSLEDTKAPDKVFFNPVGSWLVQYPAQYTPIWVIVVSLLLVSTMGMGIKKDAFTVRQMIGGFLLYLCILIVLTSLFLPLNLLVLRFLPYSHLINGVYESDGFFMAYLLLALGLFLLLSRLALRWVRLYGLVMGVYLLLFALMMALYLTAPSSTFVFLFPLLFSLAGTLFSFSLGLHRKEAPFSYGFVLLICVVPAIFMLMPIVQLLSVTFALQLPMASIAVLSLLAGLLLSLLVLIEQNIRWRYVPVLPLLLLFAGSIQAAYAIHNEQPSAIHPLHSHIGYYLNADTQEAYWASAYPTMDDWTQQFFPEPISGPLSEIYPHASIRYAKNKAEPMDIAAPVAEVLHDSVHNGERTLRIRLHSPRGAAHMELVLIPSGEKDLLAYSLNGETLAPKPIETSEGSVYFARFHGLPVSKEVILTVKLHKESRLHLIVYDQSIGLPPQLIRNAVPDYVVPEQGRESNITVIRKSYSF